MADKPSPEILARRTRKTGIVFVLISCLVLPIATAVFALGFFPYKPYFKGSADYGSEFEPSLASPPFDRVILMVVDSLRSDYVYSTSSGMEFTQGLVRSGCAVPFTARANPPTVTMPKIKAITTGSVPSYLDVILNIAADSEDSSASLQDQDNWLFQLARQDRRAQAGCGGDGDNSSGKGECGKLVFLGDDTWLKLFPGLFSRHDGTTSFFVSDFTEVDNNVTRHLDRELQQTDWDALILHYLGLDHIGHKSGSRSVHMVPKQVEMDGIIKRLYSSIEENAHFSSTLLIVLGDHGMTDEGNHGGSSPGEVSPALLFASPKFKAMSDGAGRECPLAPTDDYLYYDRIDQADLVPTISAFLNLPMPKNNLGVFVKPFLDLWKSDDGRPSPAQIQILRENAFQIKEIVQARFASEDYMGTFASPLQVDCSNDSVGAELSCLWRKAISLDSRQGGATRDENRPHTEAVLDAYFEFCYQAKEILSKASSDYKPGWMFAGLVGALLSTIISAMAAYSDIESSRIEARSNALMWLFVVLSHAATSFASSFVEMEGIFWQFMGASTIAFLFFSAPASPRSGVWNRLVNCIALLAFHRLSGEWNDPQSAVWRVMSACPVALWALVALTYGSYFYRVTCGTRSVHGLSGGLWTTSAVLTLVFKVALTCHDSPELLELPFMPAHVRGRLFELLSQYPLVPGAQVAWLGWAISVLVYFTHSYLSTSPREEKADAGFFVLSIPLLLQSKISNTPLLLSISIQASLLESLVGPCADPFRQSAAAALALPFASFFQAGGSNSIATVDLSQGYNGLPDFNLVAVGVLVFVSNWAGPIAWLCERSRLLSTPADTVTRPGAVGGAGASPVATVYALQTTAASVALSAVMLASYYMRDHLFVWSVFSPRFLYAAVWTVGYHGVMSTVANLSGL